MATMNLWALRISGALFLLALVWTGICMLMITTKVGERAYEQMVALVPVEVALVVVFALAGVGYAFGGH